MAGKKRTRKKRAGKKNPQYTKELKIAVCRAMDGGLTLGYLSDEVGATPATLYSWRKAWKKDGAGAFDELTQQQKQLLAEVKKAKKNSR